MFKLYYLLSSLLLCMLGADAQERSLRSHSPETTRSLLGKLEAPSDLVVHRINCGAGEFTDSSSDKWSGDDYYMGGWSAGWLGRIFGIGDLLTGTYREEFRWFFSSASLEYEIPVTAGSTYAIELLFPERFNWFGFAPASRQNVYLEGILAFNELTLVSNENSPRSALLVQTKPVVIKDGLLTIKFESSTNSPAIAAIAVYEIAAETNVAPTASPIDESPSAPTASPVDESPSASPSSNPPASSTVLPSMTSPTAVPSATPSANLTSMAGPTAVPSATPSSNPVSVLPPAAGPVIRINVGSYKFTDPDGNVWAKDTYGIGGNYTVEDDIEIEGTNNDALYRSELYGDFQLSIPVEPGTYEITMHFAELYHKTENARIFSILLEGDVVMKDVDLVADLGKPFVATQKTFVRKITDDSIEISGVAKIDNAKLNGLSIVHVSDDVKVPTDTPAPTEAPTQEGIKTIARINCGSYEFVDQVTGLLWTEDVNNSGMNFTLAEKTPISGSTNDALYQSERYGDFAYTFPVQNGETYQIVMHFAELYHEGQDMRVFNVILEGETVINDLDLFKELDGRFIATQYTFERTIEDGSIDIEIKTVKDNGKLSGLEIYMLP